MNITRAVNANKAPLVVIAVSLYNGEKYLVPMIDSLLRQDYPNIRIVVRDDGSTDKTLSIIDSYSRRYPEKIYRFLGVGGNIGVSRSFFTLLDCVEDAAYLMFCDQDDVWFDDKVTTFIARMRDVELDPAMPTLVFGDMIVTDQSLNVICHSFWSYQRLDPNIITDWRRLMMNNVVTGCSSMFNSAAVKLLRGVPSLPVLHDHLAATVIARYGVLAPLSKPTMFYRQHQSNVEGARIFDLRYLVGHLKYFLKVALPRYREMCAFFGVPFILAAYLKFELVFRRLFKS